MPLSSPTGRLTSRQVVSCRAATPPPIGWEIASICALATMSATPSPPARLSMSPMRDRSTRFPARLAGRACTHGDSTNPVVVNGNYNVSGKTYVLGTRTTFAGDATFGDFIIIGGYAAFHTDTTGFARVNGTLSVNQSIYVAGGSLIATAVAVN